MRLSMLLIILGMAVATYLTRGPLLAFGKRITFPPLFLRSLRYVPVAMMAAIVFPAVLAPQGRVVPSRSTPTCWPPWRRRRWSGSPGAAPRAYWWGWR